MSDDLIKQQINRLREFDDGATPTSWAADAIEALTASAEAAEAKLEIAMAALDQCCDELDAYSRQEYPGDHPVHERYRQRDYDGNTARVALTAIRAMIEEKNDE